MSLLLASLLLACWGGCWVVGVPGCVAAGVVDADLKVHSLDNLYVAGSSVFPSAGISNPTFTIIPLSIWLADHLAAQLSKASANRAIPAEAPEVVA